MAKIKGPLHSIRASGRYASNLIFRDTPHGPVATRFHFPGSANDITPSAAQLANRDNYGALVAAWRALTQPDRDQWDVDALPFGFSGWNLYLRSNFVRGIERVGNVVTAFGPWNSGTTLTLDKPVGASVGHHATIIGMWDESASLVPPAGFAHVPGSPRDLADTSIFCITKILGPSEPASWVVTGENLEKAGAVIVHSGVDQAAPVEDSASQINPASVNVIAPSVTTITPGALLLAVFGSNFSTSGSHAYTPPPEMTEEADVFAGPNSYTAVELCSELFSSPGATGTRTAVSPVVDPNAGIMLALKPA